MIVAPKAPRRSRSRERVSPLHWRGDSLSHNFFLKNLDLKHSTCGAFWALFPVQLVGLNAI